MARFTPEKRARLLGMIEGGATMEAACAACDVTPLTVRRWHALGRAGRSPEHAAFAASLDAARESAVAGDDGPMTTAELVGLLERQARRGSVRALELLIERPWETGGEPAGAGDGDGAEIEDAFAALDREYEASQ